MTVALRNRGAAPVGVLAEMPPVERAAVRCLREWQAGDGARACIQRDLARAFGADGGAEKAQALDDLMELVCAGARRPLMCRTRDCGRCGGDECAFAQMVAAAAGGDREEALLFALLLMTPNAAFEAVRCAEDLGLALFGLTRRGPDGKPDLH